jgi:hypothetical protein
VQMAKSGTVSGAEHGSDVEYAAYIVQKGLHGKA